MVKVIKLTQGREALVDVEDFDRLSKYKWHYNTKNKNDFGYAQRSQHIKLDKNKYTTKTIYMHREVLSTPLEVDHINGNKLDNRKCNLRPATRQQQTLNTAKRKGTTSSFVGVHLHKLTGKWRAQVHLNGKRVSLGMFSTQEEAKEVRQKFMKLNGLDRFRR